MEMLHFIDFENVCLRSKYLGGQTFQVTGGRGGTWFFALKQKSKNEKKYFWLWKHKKLSLLCYESRETKENYMEMFFFSILRMYAYALRSKGGQTFQVT